MFFYLEVSLNSEVAPLNWEVAPLNWEVAPLNWEVAPLNWEVAPLNSELQDQKTRPISQRRDKSPSLALISPFISQNHN
ncbi:hypothetical protein [Nostoc sp. NMS4]|uniref:hypothetical protein n=1 Tax=Nostoc sp. NMS4 TaxID=2815390 RepID=UPI0025EFE456|nr:hypothetical protein [Nostoc sp. NMS4]MBN3925961.1 hypothetical protein [Nostoc sp. NMS4]